MSGPQHRNGQRGGRPEHRPHGEQAAARERGEPTPPSNPIPIVDGEPPRPPHELDPDPSEPQLFEADGRKWVAWVAGKGAWGAGAYGLGMVDAVHFADATAPTEPLREALLARGRFAGLFEQEVKALFARAVPIRKDAPPRAQPRRGDRRGRDW